MHAIAAAEIGGKLPVCACALVANAYGQAGGAAAPPSPGDVTLSRCSRIRERGRVIKTVGADAPAHTGRSDRSTATATLITRARRPGHY